MSPHREILALRHQLAVVNRSRRRVRLPTVDRVLLGPATGEFRESLLAARGRPAESYVADVRGVFDALESVHCQRGTFGS
jgi:hypothetical protein